MMEIPPIELFQKEIEEHEEHFKKCENVHGRGVRFSLATPAVLAFKAQCVAIWICS